jgi:CheY-like chemotaxis protein
MLLKSLQTNILLIDDDEDDCYIFKLAMAEICPHTIVHCIQDREKLLEVIGSSKPSLIFIDFYLPIENGISCLQQIKSHPVYKDLPVVMWSSSCYSRNVAACYNSGAQLYIEKPCSKKSLVEKLKMILEENYISAISAKVPDCAQRELFPKINSFIPSPVEIIYY